MKQEPFRNPPSQHWLPRVKAFENLLAATLTILDRFEMSLQFGLSKLNAKHVEKHAASDQVGCRSFSKTYWNDQATLGFQDVDFDWQDSR